MQLLIQKCEPASSFFLKEFKNFKGLGVFPQVFEVPGGYTGLILRCDDEGLSLVQAGRSAATPTRVDFQAGKLRYRLDTSKRTEGLLKAVGLDRYDLPIRVLDATAGMGSDAYILAASGCEITLLEKSPVMAALLADGLQRARTGSDPRVAGHVGRMSLVHADASDYLDDLAGSSEVPDVVCLDPMFPPRRKSARVKKDMALMQELLPPNEDIDSLLAAALRVARKRVVLKRPGRGRAGKGEAAPGPRPDFVVPGKACHFQVYLVR